MARFSPGLGSENHLVTKLRDYGCKVATDEAMDHIHKLDCVILELPESQKLLPEPLGVQITTRIGDYEKRSYFLQRVTKNPYAPKNIYIELAPDLDLDKGGAFLVLVAITNFLSSSRFKEIKVVGVQIRADLTYEFQNIVAAATLQPPAAKTQSVEPGQLSGTIDWYDPMRRFGFIKTEGDVRYFFHRNDARPKFEAFLSSLEKEISSKDGNPLRVAFVNSGKAPGKKDYQAKDIYQIEIQ